MSRGALIGRDADLEGLTRALAKNRVVSMTGAPGVGKSAVASAIAEMRAAVYCGLQGATSADSVCRELARALGLPHSAATSTDTKERIGRAIASRGKLLLVLDDADLARAALTKLVPSWMADAPGARYLIAARARVVVAGAQRFELAPLEVPPATERDRVAIAASPAVQLFVRCASKVRPDYRLSAESAPHVAAIVRTLAGLPLAIELCATRVVVLGEREIAQLLSERIDALDGAASGTGGRTLRGAFELSWGQLAGEDARFLAACATFRGSFDLDGASAVTGEARLRAAETLGRLEETSLVRAFEPEVLPGARRYTLPASVRVFAAEQLARPARALAMQRHAEHYGAGSRSSDIVRPDVLALDREDLEAALTWCIEQERGAMAARVALVLAPLALSRGPLAPFLARIDPLVEGKSVPRELSAQLLLVRGLARIHSGRRDASLEDLARARKLARSAGDRRVEVLAASKTGLVVGMKGDFKAARSHFTAATARLEQGPPAEASLRGIVSKDRANVLSEEGRNGDAMIELARARDLFHTAGDTREEGFVLMMLGSRLLDDGQVDDARRDCNAGLELLRASGDQRSTAWCEVMLALADGEHGDLRASRTRLELALSTFRAIGDAHTEGLVLGYLGNVALEQGALADAEGLYRDARVRLADAGDRASEAMCTAGAAVVEAALGRAAAARVRFQHARELLGESGRAARREAVELLASVLDGEASEEPLEPALGRSEEVRFAQRVVTMMRSRLAPTPVDRKVAQASAVLVLAPDGSWVRTPEARTTKLAAGALRGIVRRLAQDRIRYPGRPVSVGALVRAGWPGETILPAAAKNRLHVTIARLRRAGLAEILLREDDGYLLDPQVAARLADPSEM